MKGGANFNSIVSNNLKSHFYKIYIVKNIKDTMQESKNAIFQMRFPQKLWYLLNLRTGAIIWGGTGRTILLNYRLLHNYLQCDNSVFKTANISSFVRQLNLYGFRKVTSHLQDPLCNSSNPYMHEYVHDYFQYDRPELLSKITRKALTMKRNLKPKNILSNSDQVPFITPLQKARQALRAALRKAAQDLYMQHEPQPGLNYMYDDDEQDDCDDEEYIDMDWLITQDKAHEKDINNVPSELEEINRSAAPVQDTTSYGNSSQDNLLNFNDDICQQNSDSFPTTFLSMPDLDSEPTSTIKQEVQLLAEFNIDNDIEDDIVKRISKSAANGRNSLNCVLPSISSDQGDDGTLVEKESGITNHYLGEWDQMFNDIMTSKGSNPECGTNLKEFYSQISQSVDLLNS